MPIWIFVSLVLAFANGGERAFAHGGDHDHENEHPAAVACEAAKAKLDPSLEAALGFMYQYIDTVTGEKSGGLSVLPRQVTSAACHRQEGFSEGEMLAWLGDYADSPRKGNFAFDGIELESEDPKLASLLKLLLPKGSAKEPELRANGKIRGCRKALCVAKAVFGEKVGVQVLFMLAKFGFNGSHFAFPDSSLWKSEELDDVLASLADLPESIQPLFTNRQLTHFTRRKKVVVPGMAEEAKMLASNNVTVFDYWSEAKRGRRIGALNHEYGHLYAKEIGRGFVREPGIDGRAPGLDLTREWMAISPSCVVSKYGATTPEEDFAEAFSAYRYNPETLRGKCPEKYEFLKEVVFDGIEYTSAEACAPERAYSSRYKKQIAAALAEKATSPSTDRCEAAVGQRFASGATERFSWKDFQACKVEEVSREIFTKDQGEWKYPRLTLAAMQKRNVSSGIRPESPVGLAWSQEFDRIGRELVEGFSSRYAEKFSDFSFQTENPRAVYCGVQTLPNGRHAIFVPQKRSGEKARPVSDMHALFAKACLRVLEDKYESGPLTAEEIFTTMDSFVELREANWEKE